MTGLLIKDWKLLKNQGRAFLIVLAMAVLLMFSDSIRQSNVVSSYLTFVVAMFAVSSFNYDEFDNGMSYLLALPVDRKTYVAEKYVFGLLLVFGAWILAMAVQIPLGLFFSSSQDWYEYFVTNILFLTMALVFLGYTFPLIIHFGTEKGRIYSFVLLIVVAGGLFFLEKAGLDRWSLYSAIDQLGRVSMDVPALFAAGAILCGLLFQGVSCLLSFYLMKKKEF